uniref:ATP-dependent Clp protease proteolytic subunit n=1 Tax=Oogamochlamys gigantea TaxID=158507 RepID=A0A0S2LNH2_9CHLO|nr:proteolytic subunit 2 of clp protease [Oogamochlamys gigantea]ALO62774.1 proteolytic subunit 2 of clp protease [Oogamochlamys gigantea]
MPIGVPRIIYCWGEELPAQWTDIYNFIFRRRMIFLMQYLDDELCNQICGLLINIHMEDRSKELEKKEIEKSNIFKSPTKSNYTPSKMGSINKTSNRNSIKSQQKAIEDLLTSEEDLAIDENNYLEQYTLQKITLDWLNWTSNFFDYANEPYLFYLTEILTKDFGSENGNLLYMLTGDLSNLYDSVIYKFGFEFMKNKQRQNKLAKSELALLAFGFVKSISSKSEPLQSFSVQRSNRFSLLRKATLGSQNEKLSFPSLREPFTGKQHDGEEEHQEWRKGSELSKFMGVFKAMVNCSMLTNRLNKQSWTQNIFDYWTTWSSLLIKSLKLESQTSFLRSDVLPLSAENLRKSTLAEKQKFGYANKTPSKMELYSPFRFLANFSFNDYSFKNLKNRIQPQNFINVHKFESEFIGNGVINKKKILSTREQTQIGPQTHNTKQKLTQQLKQIDQVVASHGKNLLISREFLRKLAQKQYCLNKQTHKNLLEFSKKALGQRTLKNEYRQDRISEKTPVLQGSSKTASLTGSASELSTDQAKLIDRFKVKNAKNYLNLNYFSSTLKNSSIIDNQSSLSTLSKQNITGKVDYASIYSKETERTFSYRKQAERTLQEEEFKKVFVIINSFGGSVGNGITVHDALQFIKAGSLTLALGVAASAASLALAGGTIGERYITEGCHTMIHQPEGSINGQASDILIDSNEIMKIRLDVAEIYSLSTYRPRHKILRDLDRDFYLTANETVYYGLADEIATNEVMSDVIEMTNKVWDYHENQQQRLLEIREQGSSPDSQTQT